jgi:hypothetical protein
MAFVAAWAILGARTDGYSPVSDPISRLAATGAPTRTAMTVGLLGYAVGVGAYSRTLPGRLAPVAAVNAAAAIAIAATPLDSMAGGTPHAIAAGVSYASLAALPLLAGHRVVAAASATALVLSLVDDAHTGLWQRTGLTVGHAWLAAGALRRRR